MFGGAILSNEWKKATWDKFVTGAHGRMGETVSGAPQAVFQTITVLRQRQKQSAGGQTRAAALPAHAPVAQQAVRR